MAYGTVLIVMGSDSDLGVMRECAKALAEFDIAWEMHVASAHRSPEKAVGLAARANAGDFDVIVAGAGMAAHLAGVLAAHATCPVLGVPIDGSALSGMDALLATVQMPPGIPVGTVAIGKAGARNAGILAAQILAVRSPELKEKIAAFKKKMAEKVEAKDARLDRSI